MVQLRSIEATIDVPPVVQVAAGAKEVGVDVRVTLRNTGDEDVVVHASSSDDRHFWHVFDSNHREVLREKRTAPGRGKAASEGGVHSFRTETVAAGHEEHASRRLSLNARKLKPGEIYTVRAEFYGHVAEARFSVVEVPGSPRKKSGKKAGKKKTGRTKAAGKKPTKKKAAKRSKK